MGAVIQSARSQAAQAAVAVGCLRAHATAFLQAPAVTRAVDQCAREFTAAPPVP